MHRGKGKGKREGRWSIKRQSRYLDRLNVLWGKIPLTSPTDKTISLAPANCQEKLIHQNGLKTQPVTFSFVPFFLSFSLSLFLSYSLSLFLVAPIPFFLSLYRFFVAFYQVVFPHFIFFCFPLYFQLKYGFFYPSFFNSVFIKFLF